VKPPIARDLRKVRLRTTVVATVVLATILVVAAHLLADRFERELMRQQLEQTVMRAVEALPEELRVAVNAYLDHGPDFIKYGGTSHQLYPSLIGFSPEAQRVIVEETQKRGLVAETHSTPRANIAGPGPAPVCCAADEHAASSRPAPQPRRPHRAAPCPARPLRQDRPAEAARPPELVQGARHAGLGGAARRGLLQGVVRDAPVRTGVIAAVAGDW
jgi:hypothetical protein